MRLVTNILLNVLCPAIETRPDGSVQEAQQRVLGRCQLHPQPHQGHVHLHHLQHDVGTPAFCWDQDDGPQEDLQQCQQDRQDVADSVPCPLRNLQPRLLGHVPQQRTVVERSCHLNVIALLIVPFFQGRGGGGGGGSLCQGEGKVEPNRRGVIHNESSHCYISPSRLNKCENKEQKLYSPI